MNTDQQELAVLAIITLAAHVSVKPGAITLESIELDDGPDTSLGCPLPDMGYLQVITPAHKALLEYRGSGYPVQLAGRWPFVCMAKNLDAPILPALRLNRRVPIVHANAGLRG